MASTILIIPTDASLYAYKEEIVLNDISYVFNLEWNSRFEYWSLSVMDVNETPIVSGIKLVYGIDLFAQFPANGLPAGNLILNGGDYLRIAEKELGDTVELLFVPKA